ncbi:MAG: hypothetical protein IJN96_06365 [Clostridia bacterium]|nr:hypothetical protein [Clostridia bacterium]
MNATIGKNKRIVLWDDYYIDSDKTTAKLCLNHPQKREIVMRHDEAWEGDCCAYHNFFRDGDIFRMYYLARDTKTEVIWPIQPGIVCYAESKDGIHWKKPSLGLRECEGTTDNNIILDLSDDMFDNFYVFKDENPACPDDEKYKGIAVSYANFDEAIGEVLWCWTSADGIHFKKAWIITQSGHFDSLNIASWEEKKGEYICYIRDYHNNEEGKLTRDIRYITSKDFKNWTTPEMIEFDSDVEFQLYTNTISPYYRAEGVYVGFPVRYTERTVWTENFDELCNRERRRFMVEKEEPRSGLALTDALFMSSHDGKKWHRFDEAFADAGLERKYNWVYGDCYFGKGLLETAIDDEDSEETEISLFANDGHHSMRPTRLYRYTIRKDGFACYRAPYSGGNIVTKPFVFEGGELEMNFATSAGGYMRVSLLDEKGERLEGYETCDIIGNSMARKVKIADEENMEKLNGKIVRLKFEMRDAAVYSFIIR